MTNLPKKHLFDIPEGMIYLDGNSLGPLPKGAAERAVKTLTQEWADYRQALRDITQDLETVEDVDSVVWPTDPSG